MGNDKRQWRKLVKKLRRSRIRKLKAELETTTLRTDTNSLPQENSDELELAEAQRLHDLEEEAWKKRERQSCILFKAKKAKEEELENVLFAEQERIRLESEEKQRIETEKKIETERITKARQAKQVMLLEIFFENEDFNQLLEFLSGDIETPPLPYLMPESVSSDEEPCLYFSRTGACRFFERCRKPHPSPTLSSTILIPNFFSHLSLETMSDDTDSGLQYEESEMHKEFISFYDDVLPEFRKTGAVIQFKVCRNFEPHMRGNLYIQYKTIREAVETYRIFNGRFYNGKQLTLRFIRIVSWRAAICGQFNRGVCLKGRSCNYLHVFRNPSREFVSADRDWENITSFRTPDPNSPRRPQAGHTFDLRRSSSISRYDQSQDLLWRTPSRSKSHSRSRSRSRSKSSSTVSRRSDTSSRKDLKRKSRSRSRSSKSTNSQRNANYRTRSRSRSHKHSRRRGRSRSEDGELSQSRDKDKKHKKKKKKKKKKKGKIT